MTEGPRRKVSGSMAAAQYRQKYESVSENTMPMLDELNSRIDRALVRARKTTPPEQPAVNPEIPIEVDDSELEPEPDTLPSGALARRNDPRREPNTDARRESDVPVDEVRLPVTKKERKS